MVSESMLEDALPAFSTMCSIFWPVEHQGDTDLALCATHFSWKSSSPVLPIGQSAYDLVVYYFPVNV